MAAPAATALAAATAWAPVVAATTTATGITIDLIVLAAHVVAAVCLVPAVAVEEQLPPKVPATADE